MSAHHADAGPSTNDEFYVGYLDTPPSYKRFLKIIVPAMVIVAVGLGAAMALLQNDPGDGVWDLGETVTLRGVVRADPYATLTVPGENGAPDRQILLVSMGKTGGTEFVPSGAPTLVNVTGFPIERNGKTLLTIEMDTNVAAATEGSSIDADRPVRVGPATLAGEIIDPKCYFGAMKPAEGRVHKACATLCIKGGIPPMYKVGDGDERTYYLLTDVNGQGIRDAALEQLLPYVADAVEIDGDVWRWGDMLTLRIDPSTIRRRPPGG